MSPENGGLFSFLHKSRADPRRPTVTVDHYLAALVPLVQDAVLKIEPLHARKLSPPARRKRPGSPLDPRVIPYVLLRWSEGAPKSQIAAEVGCGRRVLYTLVLDAVYVPFPAAQFPHWKKWGLLHLLHFDPQVREDREERCTIPVCGFCRAPVGFYRTGVPSDEQGPADDAESHLVAHVPVWRNQGPRFGRLWRQRILSRSVMRRLPLMVAGGVSQALAYVERVRQLGGDAARTEWPDFWRGYVRPWARGIRDGLQSEGSPWVC